jgi:hypothetical protein
MKCHAYLRNHVVYLPTMGKMAAGFYRGVEPVAVAPASNAEGLRNELQQSIVRGNPDVPMLLRKNIPPPVILKYAGVKSWSAFERGMLFWTMEDTSGAFQIVQQRKLPNGMWKADPQRVISFQAGASVEEVIDRMVAILQEAARA